MLRGHSNFDRFGGTGTNGEEHESAAKDETRVTDKEERFMKEVLLQNPHSCEVHYLSCATNSVVKVR